MRNAWSIIFLICCFSNLSAQEDIDMDPNYLEDQIFLSFTYNILSNKPSAISQNGLSGGVSFGFIKDIPINEDRNVGFGIGLGYAYDAYIQNLKISRDDSNTFFELAQDYNTNRLRIHSLDFPIEFRWRNSTLQNYKFWRIYGGLKLSYLFSATTRYSDEIEIKTTKNIPELNKLQYGIILAVGYGTWNIYVNYGLNKFFKDAEFEGQELDLNKLKIGLKFYIL